MKPILLLSGVLLIVSIAGILLVFVVYPLAAFLMGVMRRKPLPPPSGQFPTVTLLVVVRNAEALLEEKIRNCLALDYPSEQIDLVFVSDGSTDNTEKIIRSHEGDRFRFVGLPEHQGKIEGINRGMERCSGDVVVLSDADAILEPDSLRRLVRPFDDPEIGGVCGQRVIVKDKAWLKEAQRKYVRLDSAIKQWESAFGSISSNDGKVYGIRRALFRPIPSGVMDDLHLCLCVRQQGRRFVFEPEARASIRLPSRSARHEIERRRRIVSMSLRGIFLMKELLNPLRSGFFAFSLGINKVVRRFLPVFLILLLLSCLVLSLHSWVAALALLAQIGFYSLAGAYGWAGPERLGAVGKIASLAFYFSLGNYGTLLGLVDFLRGRRLVKWEPLKSG